MNAHATTHRHALILGWLGVVVALAVYCLGLGSDHLATNGDELLYAQITRLTAETGQLLPLQSLDEKARNTKPPLLFWQGILSTDWGHHWSLARLRLPNVLYTLLTAALLAVVGWKRTRSLSLGLMAALIFLSFFSTYRYGRVFLTSAPETFWLFLPLGLLLLHREPRLPDGIFWPWAWGGMIGIGLLYKSFALVIPVAVTLALWQLRTRSLEKQKVEKQKVAGQPWETFLHRDGWRIALTVLGALMLFSLWFWLDPDPAQVLKDFVLKENAGKFNTGGQNYLLNLIWGESSIWRIIVSYPLNAGLFAPVVLALCVDAWNRRKHLSSLEVLLWLWMVVLAVFFCLPNQRDERYLLPAMPALALLLTLRLGHLPRWVFVISAVASGIILLGLTGLGILLEHTAGVGWIYPFWSIFIPVGGVALIGLSMAQQKLTRPMLPLAILSVYLSYYAFLIPLDHGPGVFDKAVVESVSDCSVSVPANFNAREESYGFLLPGAVMHRYDHWRNPPATQFVVISLPLDQPMPSGIILGKRLNMIDRFSASETRDMLMGNVTHHLFHWDWLVQRW